MVVAFKMDLMPALLKARLKKTSAGMVCAPPPLKFTVPLLWVKVPLLLKLPAMFRVPAVDNNEVLFIVRLLSVTV